MLGFRAVGPFLLSPSSPLDETERSQPALIFISILMA